MATIVAPPRFFKVFISHFSSDSMLIPISYYDQLPRLLPETAILQGTGGCFWTVEIKKKRDEVFFGQGWSRFVKDNSLTDGDFMTFVYNGDRIFEVSIYDPYAGCKETRAVNVEDNHKEDSICSLSSEDTDTSSESEMANTIPTSKNKGKKVEVVEDSDEDSDDSDYVEAFSNLDLEEDSSSDSSYSPDWEDTTTKVKPKVKKLKTKGKSILMEDVEALGDTCDSVEPVKRREKVKAMIKNPEAYLDNPKNVYFETGVKNRTYELLVHAQLVKDYCLKFQKQINYIDAMGKVEAKTVTWKDHRVCIKRWILICQRNKLKKKDRVVCELLRKQDLVYAIKIHIVRENVIRMSRENGY